MKASQISALGLFAVATLLAWWRSPTLPESAIVSPVAGTVQTTSEFASDKVPIVAAFAHAPSLATLPGGKIALVYDSGSRELAPDVDIRFSIWSDGKWSAPRVVATRRMVAEATGASTSKLGNPVMLGAGGRLDLWFSSAGFGGWSVTKLNHMRSLDGGATWSAPTRLETSPFFNLASNVRASPRPMSEGEVGLPVYDEFIAVRPEWLRLAADGRILAESRMAAFSALQPAVAPLDSKRAIGLLRNPGRNRDLTIQTVHSDDAGATWSASPSTGIVSNDSSVAVIRLSDGRLLMAADPGAASAQRNVLQLFLSLDEGLTWRPSRIIDGDADLKDSFDYPSLLQTEDGLIHVAYAWSRHKTIAHVVFSTSWLNGEAP